MAEAPSNQKCARMVGYCVAMGHEEEFLKLAAKMETGIDKINYHICFTMFDETTNIYSVCLVFDNEEELAKYKQEQKAKYLNQVKKHLVAGPTFQQEGKVRWMGARNNAH